MNLNVFIQRPILASVCSFLFLLGGLICIPNLPLAQYPDIAPPQIRVQATYLGANADTVESAVTTPLEKEINGAEGVQYITSTSTDNGSSQISVVIDRSRNLDDAIIDIQNRIKKAEPRLPQEVRQSGVQVNKFSPEILMVVAFYAENRAYDNYFISNYVDRYVVESLKRLKGVGDIRLFGERKYAMRLWLDNNKLAALSLSAGDVVKALQEQNIQVAAGQIGQMPAPEGQAIQLPIKTQGRLQTVEEFENIILKRSPSGALIHFKDIGRVELGAEDYSTLLRFNGDEKAVGMVVNQLPGSNAIEVDKNLKIALKELEAKFPPGLHYKLGLNPTEFVKKSIDEVIHTLIEAILLVVLVIFIFLQNWRSVLIPVITVPISLIGTFIFVKAFGFSINTLTLFGLTLATGLVVDDAIVVLENIERLINEKKMSSFEAATESMKEISGAVMAISLVLMAVFIPVSFLEGATGQLYRQFALTIAFSIAISTFNALTLTPALSVILLRNHAAESHKQKNKVFQFFDSVIDGSKYWYAKYLSFALRAKGIVVIIFIICSLASILLLQILPKSFVASDDRGYLIVSVQSPSGSSIEVTKEVMKKAEKIIGKQEEVLGIFSIVGFSFLGSGPSKGTIFVPLKNLEDRIGKGHSSEVVLGRLRGALGGISEGIIVGFPPAPLPGLGNFGGFQYELKAEGSNIDLDTLAGTAADLVKQGNQTKGLVGLFTGFTTNDPRLVVEINREKAKSLNVNLKDIFDTLQIYLGSQYVNDFEIMNRIYRVYVQADQQFRANPEDITNAYVRSLDGQMISLNNFLTVKEETGAQNISHFNLFRSVEINGSAAPGFSSGQALDNLKNLSERILPKGFSYEWGGLAREEVKAGSQAIFVFVFGFIFVFLILAALYESLIDPIIILLSVPLAIFGGLLAQYLRGLQNDVFCQIGLLMLIGLASKNAILIVEFANQLYKHKNNSPLRAVIKAARTRYRPIIMTSLAFIFGIWPLVVAQGAGENSRHSLGTVVLGGMIAATVLSLFVVPIIYLFLVKKPTQRN